MIYLLLLISSTLLLAVIHWKRSLDSKWTDTEQRWVPPEKKKSVKYLFLKGTLEFLIPFTITASIFSALQLWIDIALQSVDVTTTISKLETHIRLIRKFVAPFKLDDWKQLLILIALLLLGYFLPKIKELQVLKRYQQSTRLITRLYIVLTMLASFTFFSNQTDKAFNAHIVKLSAQIEETKKEYNAYRSELVIIAGKIIAREIAEGSEDIIDQLTKITNELIAINREIKDTEDKLPDFPFIAFRTFPLDIEKFKSDFKGDNGNKNGGDNNGPHDGHPGPDNPPPSSSRGGPPGPLDKPPSPSSGPSWHADKGDWNLDTGRKLASEAREVNQKLGESDSLPLAEIVEKSVDTLHSDVIKGLILQFITNAKGGVWNLLDVGLEPDVFYNCNNKIGQFVQGIFDRTIQGRQPVVGALAAQQQEMGEQIGESCLKNKSGYAARLKIILMDLLRGRAQVERINWRLQQEITSKANAEYSRRWREFRENWSDTYYFGEIDTTNASASLESEIERSLARVRNPLERLQVLQSYTNRLNFSSNRSLPLNSKYTFLTTFEQDNMSVSTFQSRAKGWFRAEHARVGSIRKYCEVCKINVPSYSRPGMTCPFCGVLWGSEHTTTTVQRRQAEALP